RIFSFIPSIVNRLPSERIDNSIYVRKIIDQKIGPIFCKLFAAPGAGRDGDGARTERLTAGDIARGVADDVDFGRGEFAAVLFFCASPSEWSEAISILMIVGKRAELKKMPDTIVFKL